MKPLPCLAVLGLALASCNHPQRTVSPLQRFDTLKVKLKHVSAGSTAVQSDVRTLSRRIQSDDVEGSRSISVRLKRHAMTFGREARSVAGSVMPLIRVERNATVRQYFRLVEAGLQRQSEEAGALVRLANVVWLDPLMKTAQQQRAVSRTQGSAQWYAYQAMRSLDAAARLRARHRRAFRYVRVRSRSMGA